MFHDPITVEDVDGDRATFSRTYDVAGAGDLPLAGPSRREAGVMPAKERNSRSKFSAGVPGLEQEQLKARGSPWLRPRVVENPRVFAVLMGVQCTDEYRLMTANLVASRGNLVAEVVTCLLAILENPGHRSGASRCRPPPLI
jgi:hypothetical protein